MQTDNQRLNIYDECIYIPVRKMGYRDINPWQAGYQKCSPGYSTPPHIRDHYLFHYITSGKGTFCIDGKAYQLSRGQMFLIQPGRRVIYYADKENPWSYIWVGFDGEFAKWLDKLKENVFEIEEDVFQRIKSCSSYSDMREVFLASCIAEIICKILDNPQKSDVVSTVKAYINETSIAAVSVSALAESFDLNPDYLSSIFKTHTGVSLRDYIVTKKMKIAKNYINDGFDLSSTAQLVGYSDISTFSRAYKKHFGYPPSKEKKWNA